MSTIPSANGNGKLTYWLLGVLGTLFTGGALGWLTSMNSISRSHGERIAVIESQIIEQKAQLDKIDHKLDRILEQKGK